VPDVRLLEVDRARDMLAHSGLGMHVWGPSATGGRVAVQSPAPGTLARPGTFVELTLTAAEEETADLTIPDLRGLPLREAISKLSASAIEIGRIRGSGAVVEQTPEAGTIVRRGTKCSLVLAPRGT